MKIYDKDLNYLQTLPDELKLHIGDILEINDDSYVINYIEEDNVRGEKRVHVETLLHNKLNNHILSLTYDYYTPRELQVHLRKVGLEIKLMDDA